MNWKYIKSISKNNRQWIVLRNVCSLLANKLAAQIVRDEIIITKLHPLLFQAPLSQTVLKICMIPLLSTEQSLHNLIIPFLYLFSTVCVYTYFSASTINSFDTYWIQNSLEETNLNHVSWSGTEVNSVWWLGLCSHMWFKKDIPLQLPFFFFNCHPHNPLKNHLGWNIT